MSEKQIEEAIKIINNPIIVNTIQYHYFDDENYRQLQYFIINCREFINQQENICEILSNRLDKIKTNVERIIEIVEKQPSENKIKDDWILNNMNGILEIIEGDDE